MSSSPDWRSSASFSERLSNVLKIAEAYKEMHPGVSGSEAQAYARDIEDENYRKALSLTYYNTRIGEEIHHLRVDHHSRATSATDVLPFDFPLTEDPSSRRTIGPYTSAEYLLSTPSSTVYRAPSLTSPQTLIVLKLAQGNEDPPPHNSRLEAEILKSLTHANVLPLIDVIRLQAPNIALILPYEPYTLFSLIRAQKLPPPLARLHVRALFQALSYIHEKGIIHRDIKPDNILLRTPEGPAFLADFGTAWSPSFSISREPEDRKITDVGTTCYRPPELLFGFDAYDTTLDLWAAGCVAAEIVTRPSKRLFDSGDLGSELALIQSHFQNLGTPTDETWPGASEYPDWGKMGFRKFEGKPWEELLPGSDEIERDFVAKLVRFERSERITAEEALKHPFLTKS